MSDEGDPRLRLVWEEALRAVERQEVTLEALHSRATALLTAASIAAGFLGAAALGEGQKFSAWTWLGALAFAAVGVLTAWILRPRKGWKLHRTPKNLLAGYVDVDPPADLDEMHRELARHLEDDYGANEAKLAPLFRMLSISCAALAIEILAFLADLQSRG